jgi:polyphosphate kinase 2
MSDKKSRSGNAMPHGIEVVIDGIEIDLDAENLPDRIEERAFASGDFPYPDAMKSKPYEHELRELQIELLKLQSRMHETGGRVVIVFEGRDSAGKGGTIARFIEHLNPRSAHVVALAKPNDAERGQWYFQRYIRHLPTSGEFALFDRSWYNRAVVEPVMGFCRPEETALFLEDAPRFEAMIAESGITLIKFWLTVGREMQVKRLHDRRHDPLKRWKLSQIDYDGLPKWDDYTRAAETMLERTHSTAAPWTVVRANDKRRLRLACLRHVLTVCGHPPADGKPADPEILFDAAQYLAAGHQP